MDGRELRRNLDLFKSLLGPVLKIPNSENRETSKPSLSLDPQSWALGSKYRPEQDTFKDSDPQGE